MNKKSYTLIVIAVLTTLVLGIVYYFAAPLIQQNRMDHESKTIAQLLNLDNTIIKQQSFELLAPHYLNMGDTQKATRAYDKDGPRYIVIKTLTKGYNGYLALILSMSHTCSIGTVEILNEHETPGLGDQYKKNDGAWLKRFSGKNKENAAFSLTRSGGDFDAWTGATVTPQAIVRALKLAVDLCEQHQPQLFSDAEVVYAEE